MHTHGKHSGNIASASARFVTAAIFTTTVALLTLQLSPGMATAAVDYDIVYVRQPRFGDNTNTTWAEVAHPASLDPGADLILLHPDGTEEVLVTGGNGSVADPFVSFDAQWIYYAYFYDLRPQAINNQRGLPYLGSDIFRINVATRQIQQLTFGEFTPNTGAGHFDESNPVDPGPSFDSLGYGILNLGPAPVAGGKVAFTSNRNGFVPPKGLTNPTLQLFVMDEDGANVTQIAPMNIGSALHPTPLRDGRLMFSTMETQGLRDDRMWGIWSIYPDGRHWSPVVSAFHEGQAFHFMTQLSNDDLVVTDYYNLNDNGFGALFRLPIAPPDGTPRFYPAFPDENPSIQQTVGAGFSYPFEMPFTPWGLYSIVPFTHGNDEAAPIGANGVRVGKFTHPSAAPNGDLLVVWSPGPANSLDRPSPLPYYDGGLYLIPGGNIANSPADLVLIKNDPAYNEAWPRAVMPYRAVHGVDEPDQLPWLPNDGTDHPQQLPAGTPYGLIGTSSLYKRESFPGVVTPWANTFDGLDAFNTAENDQSSNWSYQGSDAGKYSNSDIWAIRVVGLEPSTHRSYGPDGGPSGGQLFFSHAMERMRILGEIPVRKFDASGNPILDPEGNPDTSFLARIPADQPFTFQMLDRNGMVLAMAQTWHQVRPGEARYDCGGCHAHSELPLSFDTTYAARPDYQVPDLTKSTPLLTQDADGNPALRTVNLSAVTVEFYRDIRPILQSRCVSCHTQSNPTPPGNLVLDDYTLYGDDGLPGDYERLADDQDARWGYPPLVTVGHPVWRQTNASRYIRMFQSRRSLLIWKLFGQRLDGWSNADHPTESVPGDPNTLPAAVDPNAADLDYAGTMMPPPSSAPPLSIDEKMLFARWIDLGCPIDAAQSTYGWFLDDLRPTLAVSAPRPGPNDAPLTEIRVGVADADSGIKPGSLSVTADIAVAGRPPGAELADLATQVDDGIYSIALTPAIQAAANASLLVMVSDNQGNITRAKREFSVGSSLASPTPTGAVSSPPSPTATPTVARTSTSTPSPTGTPTPIPPATPTRTASFTRTATRRPTSTLTPTRPATATATRPPTRTATRTSTPTPTATRRPTRTPSVPPTNTATRQPTRTATPVPTRTPTSTATRTPTRRPTLARTATPSPVPTRTSTSTSTWTPTRFPTATPTAMSSATAAVAPPSATVPPTATAGGSAGPMIGGCGVFPADNIWNRRIDGLPVDANSQSYVTSISPTAGLHPDFGAGLWDGGPIGIPFVTVPGSQPFVPIIFTAYGDESDPGPYPVPSTAPVEGGSNSTGDRHVLAVDSGNCTLYEMYDAFPQADGSWQAGSGAVFNLSSDALRPSGWTSADAAGFAILPGLVRYDEVVSGAINHALRFTVPRTRQAYVWPARHYASSSTDPTLPPMGQRFRLKAGFDVSQFSPANRVILAALKTYGMFIADNGSAWFLSGVPDDRWNNDDLHLLQTGVHGSDFEAVDESSLMIDPSSAQAR